MIWDMVAPLQVVMHVMFNNDREKGPRRNAKLIPIMSLSSILGLGEFTGEEFHKDHIS